MGKQEETESGSQEVVFVLRLRPGSNGWRGQVQRLGDQRQPKPLYVLSTYEIYMLLDGEWQMRAGITEPSPSAGARIPTSPDGQS